MRRSLIVIVSLGWLAAVPSRADGPGPFDLSVETSLSSTSNLLADSSEQGAAQLAIGARGSFVPLAAVRGELSGQWLSHRRRTDYNYGTFGLSVWAIPGNDTITAFDIGLVYRERRHRAGQRQLNRRNLGVTAGLAHAATDKLRVRGALIADAERYEHVTSANQTAVSALVGANITLAGPSTVDVSLEGGLVRYQFLDLLFTLYDPDDPTKSTKPGVAGLIGGTVRWSAPLSALSGVMLAASARTVVGTHDRALLGFSTGYLTPWKRLSRSVSLAAQVKMYSVPRAIVIASVTLEQRRYHETIEDLDVRPLVSAARRDKRMTFALDIRIPWRLGSRCQGELVIEPQFADVLSNLSRYQTGIHEITVSADIAL